jgi:hypothetical protein
MAEQDIEVDLESGEEIKSKAQETEHEDDDRESDRDDQEVESSDDDERASKSADDSELDNAEDENERESIRERRRRERQHKKQAQKEREDTMRRELAARDSVINELRAKMDAIERRNSGSEVAQLENAKKQTAQAYAHFKDQIRIATEAGNGLAVADATEKMMQAQRKFDELTSYEKAVKQRQAQPQPLDPRLVNHAQQWMERNKWYDPSAKDEDSHIVLTMDQRLAQEGWDPTTPEYWEELQNRVKKYLPHRVSGGNVKSTKPKSVVSGSGRESGSGASSTASYKLSSERVQALKDAGIWDDPKQRADAVKRFRDYDKQNQG